MCVCKIYCVYVHIYAYIHTQTHRHTDTHVPEHGVTQSRNPHTESTSCVIGPYVEVYPVEKDLRACMYVCMYVCMFAIDP
jgi:hypothetical protein